MVNCTHAISLLGSLLVLAVQVLALQLDFLDLFAALPDLLLQHLDLLVLLLVAVHDLLLVLLVDLVLLLEQCVLLANFLLQLHLLLVVELELVDLLRLDFS